MKPVHRVTLRPGGQATLKNDNCTIIVECVTTEEYDKLFGPEVITSEVNINPKGEVESASEEPLPYTLEVNVKGSDQ